MDKKTTRRLGVGLKENRQPWAVGLKTGFPETLRRA